MAAAWQAGQGAGIDAGQAIDAGYHSGSGMTFSPLQYHGIHQDVDAETAVPGWACSRPCRRGRREAGGHGTGAGGQHCCGWCPDSGPGDRVLSAGWALRNGTSATTRNQPAQPEPEGTASDMAQQFCEGQYERDRTVACGKHTNNRFHRSGNARELYRKSTLGMSAACERNVQETQGAVRSKPDSSAGSAAPAAAWRHAWPTAHRPVNGTSSHCCLLLSLLSASCLSTSAVDLCVAS